MEGERMRRSRKPIIARLYYPSGLLASRNGISLAPPKDWQILSHAQPITNDLASFSSY